jgi:glycosyltransferase involved in cell wall biosynthesis
MFAPLNLTHFSYDSPWNPSFGGGGAQRDWEILRRLQGPWNVTYAVGGFPGRQVPHDCVHWLGNGSGRWSGRMSYVAAASRYARNHPPTDGLWSISPSVFAPVPAYLAHPDRTAVSLFHLVGWNAWTKYGPLGLVALWHERQILSRMRHFLCINGATAREVSRRRPDAEVSIVPTGFSPLLDTGTARVAERILFFGRIDLYMKGIDRLLQAFAILAPRQPGSTLVLAGRADAKVRAHLAQLVGAHPFSDRITVVTNPDDRVKAELFHAASVFCSPSRFEGWCIAAVEAQSCGIPVVASTADGFLDSVDDGVSGLLVPNEESSIVAGIAAAIERVLTDWDLAGRLGCGGRAKAATLTWDSVAQRHDEVFRGVLAGATSRGTTAEAR